MARTKAKKTAVKPPARKNAAKAKNKKSLATLVLPERFDGSAAASVATLFLDRRGTPLVVDASHVGRVGAQSVQVLVSAVRTWKFDGVAMTISNPARELLDGLRLLGLVPAELLIKEVFQ